MSFVSEQSERFVGHISTDKPLYMPWMQATYIMVADKRALPYLPAGADINALTYDQLAQWGRTLMEKTGRRQIGFPAGQRGLMRAWTFYGIGTHIFGLAVATACDRVEWYILARLFVFNGALAALVVAQRRASRRFFTEGA